MWASKEIKIIRATSHNPKHSLSQICFEKTSPRLFSQPSVWWNERGIGWRGDVKELVGGRARLRVNRNRLCIYVELGMS